MAISLTPALINDYARQWRRMEPNDPKDVRNIAHRIERGRTRYQAVSEGMGGAVPWYIIGILHYREASTDMGLPNEAGKFQRYLGNGEPIDRETTLWPKGRGPFDTWEAGAHDALELKLKPADKPGFSVETFEHAEACAFFFEMWNGMGYRMWHPETPSEYLWGLSSVHCRGKYTADASFDPNARTKQVGAMVCLRGLADAGLIPLPSTMDLPAEPKPAGWYERVLLQQTLNRIAPRMEPLKIDGAIGPDPETSPTRKRLADVGLVMADQISSVT